MQQAVGADGRIVQGLFRAENNTLVVQDKTAYEQFQRQQQLLRNQQEQIRNLTAEVAELRELFQVLTQQTKE